MTPDQADAISQLPLAALLLFLGAAFFGLLLLGKLRFDREVVTAQAAQAKAEKDVTDWKATATKMTEVNATQNDQIKSLTESVATLTRILQGTKA